MAIRFLMVLDPVESLNPVLSERALMEMLGALDDNWEVHFLHSRPTSYRELPCRYVIHKVPFGSRPRSPIFKLLYTLASIFVGVRVVKAHGIYFTGCKGGHLYLGLAAYLISRITHRPCLLRINEDTVFSLMTFLRKAGLPHFLVLSIGKIARLLEHHLLSHADYLVTHGPTHFKRLRKITDRISLVPLGVDMRRFRRLPEEAVSRAKKALLQGGNKKIILFVGRLHPMKDLPTLLEAFRILRSRRNDLVLLLVGWGPEAEELMRLAEELGISEDVRFLGVIPNERLPIYYNMADVYVLPSLYEEWSNTIMEAMACGTPVVATAVGGNPFLIRDGETGFLVPPGDPGALAEKISLLLEDKDLARRIAARALEAIREYDIWRSRRAYKEIMLSLLRFSRESH